MAHPRMYDDDDPVLARVRAVTSVLPGTVEKESWGRPTFRVAKIYAAYGAGEEHPNALIIKPEEDERDALLDDPRFFVPRYYGASGWLALDLTHDADWLEIAELLASSYRQVAAPALVRDLDAAWPALLHEAVSRVRTA